MTQLKQSLVALTLVMISATAGQPAAHAQAITIDTSKGTAGPMIDRRYAQVQPTDVALPKDQIDARGHQDILRALSAEQGFAMRPFPRGKKGLTLAANGKLSPSGEGYLSQITEQGLSVTAGDRVVLSNIRIEKEKIVFDLNGGPEHKNEFLRHIQIGAGGPNMTRPVVQDPGTEPMGSRVTLTFAKYVPELNPAQVKALLAPLISFDMKTPVQAYTDTLPAKLKEAILGHHVLVGMNTDMVLFSMGQPESKSREVEGQTPFEEWIYGHPPQEVNFVRVNGNRVIRVEIAKLGQPLEIFTKDEVEGLMMTDGKPAFASTTIERPIQLGDVHRDPNTQSAEAPPSLRAPGEKLPTDTPNKQDPGANREGANLPVIFPEKKADDPAIHVGPHPKPAAPTDDDDADPRKSPASTAKREPYKPQPGEGSSPSAPAAAPANSAPATPAGQAPPLNLLPARAL